MNKTIVIEKVNLKLLKRQLQSIYKIRYDKQKHLTKLEIEHMEGLMNFIEAILDKEDGLHV